MESARIICVGWTYSSNCTVLSSVVTTKNNYLTWLMSEAVLALLSMPNL